MTLIELGELTAAERPPGPEMSGQTRRMLLAALVAVACLLGLGASASGPVTLGAPLWSGLVSLVGYSLGPRSVYLAEPNGRVVLARELRTGAERWRLDIDELPLASTYVGDGIVAVQTRIPAPANQGTNTLTLLRESDGQVVGTTYGDMLGPSADGHRMIMVRSTELANDSCPEFGRPCLDVVGVVAATGQEASHLSLPGDRSLSASIVDGVVDSFAVFQLDGTIDIYDANTGARVETMTRPGGITGGVLLTPDRVMTTERSGENIRVEAYRRGSGSLLWTRTISAPDNPEYPTWWLTGDDCGLAICIRADDRTVLLDRDSGRPLFTFDGEIGGAIGGGVLIGFRLGGTPGMQEARDLLVLDPRSGEVMTTVRAAKGVYWPGSGGQVLLAQQGPDRTAFVLVEASGRTRVLGSVDGIGLNCQARDAVLACAAPSGLLRVWSLPVAAPQNR